MKTFALIVTLFAASAQLRSGDEKTTHVCLSSEEKKLYDLIMDYRKSKKLKSIPYSAKLSQVAQAHVRDLEDKYDYENRGDCNPHSWSQSARWSGCCYTADHKQAQCMWDKPREIAGYDSEGFEIAYYSSAGANAIDGLEGWKKSAGHNPLLINTGVWKDVEWKAIGIGIYGKYGVVWFGRVEDDSKLAICN
ncbi:MAG: CAP domain-containing protein [Cyclobacteriaceae bacterium]